MLLMDQDFFKVVINGINRGRIREDLDSQILKNLVTDLYKTNESQITRIIDGVRHGHIDPDNFESLIREINSNHNVIRTLNSTDTPSEPLKIDLVTAPKERLIVYSSHPEKYRKALEEIHCQLKEALSNIESKEMLFFDLNKLIGSFNVISGMSNLLSELPVPKEETSYGAVISTSNNKDIDLPLTLPCGEKIILPLTNPDLSKFERTTLLDILETLDTLPYPDLRYDLLRSKIATELSK
jgi:hypothetical protein